MRHARLAAVLVRVLGVAQQHFDLRQDGSARLGGGALLSGLQRRTERRTKVSGAY